MKQVKITDSFRIIALVVGLFLSMSAFAQSVVKGQVKDASGEPVIGATIIAVGQNSGTVTDINGNFSINARANATLKVSYIGYKTTQAQARNGMVVILQEDSELLDDVVVIGYGSVKKNDLTGSVVAIRPEEENKGFQVSVQDMLQGKIAGLNINSSSGAPGDGAQIRIRGGASLTANNEPLIVIDGMPMNNSKKGMNNPLALVNPNDVESFTVLKDASATAIYGSRGSNGVIIITTKKGVANKTPKISYNGTVSASTVAEKLDVMNAREYVNFIKYAYGEDSPAYAGLGWRKYNDDGTPDYAAGTFDTDWQDEIYRAGISQDHNISVTGGVGNENWSMPYRVSVGYTGQNGILKGSEFDRFTAGITLNPSLLDNHLNFNVNAKYAFTETKDGGRDAIGAATAMDPTRPVKSDDPQFANWGGYWQWTKTTDVYDPTYPFARNDDAPKNPVELVENYNNYKNSHVLLGTFEADYKVHGFEDLRLHMNLSGDYSTGSEFTRNNPKSTYGYYFGGNGENQEKRYNLSATGYAQYYKDFNEDHHLDVMAGYEYSHMKYWGDLWYKDYYPETNLGTNSADGTPLAGTVNTSNTNRWRGQTYLVSWFGRANYTLLNKYLFTFTARYDGSSRFSDGNRWGFFPSAAFAWRVSDEAFLKDVDAISDLKLRLGWGKTGQQDTGKEYYTPIYSTSTNDKYYYPVGGGNSGILYRPLPYNDDLTWETTTTYNVGLDYGMFNQRLVLNVDAYYRKTTDLLCTPTIPAGQNFDNTILLNAGELENKGVEIAITGRPVQTKDWFVELSANIAYNDNEITELYGGRDVIEAGMQVGTNEMITYHKVGMPANTFWVYQQVYDESGRPVMGCYVDRNGDGITDENDRYYYKSIIAPWTGGFSFKVSYKNWDLGANFRASFGNYVYNAIEQGKVNTAVLCNSKGYYENSTKDIVDLGWSSYNYSLSDHFVQNASFIKCDNITLGYSFDNLFKFGSYKGLAGRVYASCSNVFTLTDYKGLDPEQTSGRESSVYPRSRTFLFGLNLNF